MRLQTAVCQKFKTFNCVLYRTMKKSVSKQSQQGGTKIKSAEFVESEEESSTDRDEDNEAQNQGYYQTSRQLQYQIAHGHFSK